MAVTIQDVAAKCGLSVALVGEAFANGSNISSDARELIYQAARELGYDPHGTGSPEQVNRSYHLGVLFQTEGHNGLLQWFFTGVLDAFKREAERRGYDVTFINRNIGLSGMTYLDHCHFRRVDGVCIVCADFNDPEVIDLAMSDIPCVTIDHAFKERDCVQSDNLVGMQKIVDYAVSLGHQRIAYIHGQRRPLVTQQRVAGYYRAMREHWLEPEPGHVVESVYDEPNAAYRAVISLMRQPNPPTCILLADDRCCLGALDAAKSLGLRVPEDLSIGGYDGNPMMQLMHPQITTVEQDVRQMGTQAAELLIGRIEHPDTEPGEIVKVTPRILPGESIGPVKLDIESDPQE